jgi:hypothetical protein
MSSDHDLVMFEFGRHRLATLDFGPFLQRYAPEQWPSGTALRKQLSTLMVSFHGFDQDARELHCIPEVRRFVKELHQVWPYWLYFLCPAGEFSPLPVLAACCLDRVNIIQIEGSSLCGMDCDPNEMKRFLDGLVPAFKIVADQAKLFPALRREHLIENYALFGLVPDEPVLQLAGAV